MSSIKQLKKVNEGLKKFTVEDFEKTQKIIKLFNKWSLLWNGDDFLDSEDILEMLSSCIWYAKKNA